MNKRLAGCENHYLQPAGLGLKAQGLGIVSSITMSLDT
jgi:hypothetical protein